MKTLLRIFACILPLLAPALVHAQGELPLKSGDRITITIGAIPDNEVAQINKVYTISDNGTVNLLHIGEVRATGIKPSALQKSIEQIYISREIYTRPNVLVSIDNAAETARQVYVTGVNRPGPVPFRQSMTISQAIQSGGGPTAFGRMSRVKLIRGGRATEHNLTKSTGDPSVDWLVQPDDQIIVPE